MMRECTLRRKAKNAGYRISKGFQHQMTGNYPVAPDREVGYNVEDLTIGCLVWGCYNEIRDHLWTLEDVEEFLREVYEDNGLTF